MQAVANRAKTLLNPARRTLANAVKALEGAAPSSPCLVRLRKAVAELSAPLTTELVSALSLVHDVCNRLRGYADTKAVALVVYCTCEDIRVHVQSFSDAVSSLVVNAIDAARCGSQVIIAVHPTRDGDVLWEIQDGGKGMMPDAVAALGAMHAALKEPHLNIGVGVVLAQLAIERHGGLLHFESALGVGTTARAWLPISA